MTARVLIVDDVPANVRLLEARLTAEYFDIVTANSAAEAIEVCRRDHIDIVLLDVMMPEMDGFECCRVLKSDPQTSNIPVVMITALDQPSDRVRGLEAGADDFLTKPVDDMQLVARVRSLVRLKLLIDELRARSQTGQELTLDDTLVPPGEIGADNAKILLIDTDRAQAERIRGYLEPLHRVTVLADPADAIFQVADGGFELALVSMGLAGFDALRVCSQMRTVENARNLPIILMAEDADRARVVRGLDIGINDFIVRPIDRNELAARVKTQIKRHRYAAELRRTVTDTMALAVTDELTGLYNRRYFDRHLRMLLDRSHEQGRDLALMMLDIDYFKHINDTHGHSSGDLVLREFAGRLLRNIRGVDMACRYGGEEFVVLMPDADLAQAQMAAERIRASVAERPFEIANKGGPLRITVSVGVALNETDLDTPDSLLRRADIALYRAKREGRNRVVFDAA
ncbi:MAG TPA: PleD family two-component system response regulator [Devosiaceae bacterium]